MFFKHEKRPAWGMGKLLQEEGDRVRILFEDGKERTLKVGAPGLLAVSEAEAPESLVQVETTAPVDDPGSADAPVLIKAVRLAIRDALGAFKNKGAFPDDTLVDMQKGLSRITADYARFAATSTSEVRAAKAKEARALLAQGIDDLFDALAERLDEGEGWEGRTRTYGDPEEAKAELAHLARFTDRGLRDEDLEDGEIEALVRLLTPADLAER